MIDWQLYLEQIDPAGAWYWVPVVQAAETAEEAIDRILESSIGELAGGWRYRRVQVVPRDKVQEFELERQPRPYFRRTPTP